MHIWKPKGRGDEEINLVDIQGTIGASAQIGRTEGFDEAVEAHDNWTTLAQQSGEFTQAKRSGSYGVHPETER